MTQLPRPKTVAVPWMNRRMVVEDYRLTVPNIWWNGIMYIVRIEIFESDMFTWDGMSIPKLAQRYVGNPFGPKHELAGLIHDNMYYTGRWPREVADLLMLMILEFDGETKFKRNTMYKAVKYGGKKAWKNHRELDKKRCLCIDNGKGVKEPTQRCMHHRDLLIK